MLGSCTGRYRCGSRVRVTMYLFMKRYIVMIYVCILGIFVLLLTLLRYNGCAILIDVTIRRECVAMATYLEACAHPLCRLHPGHRENVCPTPIIIPLMKTRFVYNT